MDDSQIIDIVLRYPCLVQPVSHFWYGVLIHLTGRSECIDCCCITLQGVQPVYGGFVRSIRVSSYKSEHPTYLVMSCSDQIATRRQFALNLGTNSLYHDTTSIMLTHIFHRYEPIDKG